MYANIPCLHYTSSIWQTHDFLFPEAHKITDAGSLSILQIYMSRILRRL